ncbi:restriction endonuclease subunit S [Ketobacter sp. GenoA1]|uniref:restriction endonuclease subunit S n=1 Tax=Ketobacter sp. GenoA1 TaxID=2072747 RepID=UPI000F16E8A3|nr:MAG: restriction endonuclease subunit S [Ketobacter sp. GenoA1]
MQGYPTYKDSEVEWIGRIPASWDIRPLFTVASESKISNKGMIENNLLSLSYGRIIQKDIETLGGLLPESFETYQVVNENDIIFRLTDLQNDKRSLRSAICRERGIITSAYVAVTPKKIRPKFMHYLMRSYDEIKVFYNLGSGMRQSLKYDELKRLPLVTPPESDQKQVEDFLDRETARIDNLIAEKQTFINLLKEKRQALISHVVTKGLDPNVKMRDSGVEWIGEVPEHWECVSLKRLVRNIEQGWSPECHSNPAKENCWGVLKSGAVNGGVYQAQENKELPENFLPRPEIEVKSGDLIMSRASGSRDLIGSAAYVYETRSKLMLSDKLFRLNCLDDINPEFVSICLGSYPLRRQIELAIGGAEGLANNLSQSNIKRLFLAKPPKAEQGLIVSALKKRLEGFDRIIVETSRSIELLREHRTALISAAVTGKVDVRNYKEEAA